MARILVVDDDPAQRFLFVQILRRAGFDALAAEDGETTFAMLNSKIAIDAVLLDMVLPGMDSTAIYWAIQQHFPRLPVVMMSVRPSREWNLDTHQPGIYFLQKPFEIGVLSETLLRVMRDVRQEITS